MRTQWHFHSASSTVHTEAWVQRPLSSTVVAAQGQGRVSMTRRVAPFWCTAAERHLEGYKLFVGDLPLTMTQEELDEWLGGWTCVADSHIRSRAPHGKGWAIITCTDAEQCEQLKQWLHSWVFFDDGRRAWLTVQWVSF